MTEINETMADRSPPEITAGQVIRPSLIKSLFWVWLFLVGSILGPLYVWASLSNLRGWLNLTTALLITVCCPLAIYALVRSWFNRERLFLGSRFIQVLRRIAGKHVVVAQIPYANAKLIQYQLTDAERRIGIDLVDLDDPETYAADLDFQTHKQLTGWHFLIEDSYSSPILAIHQNIYKIMGQFTAKELLDQIVPKPVLQPLLLRIFFKVLVAIMILLLAIVTLVLAMAAVVFMFDIK